MTPQRSPAGRKRGTPKTGGRKKGVPNKLTKALKEMILGALADAGGQKYLTLQAKRNPAAFLALLGRILPYTLNAELNGGVITVHRAYGPPIEEMSDDDICKEIARLQDEQTGPQEQEAAARRYLVGLAKKDPDGLRAFFTSIPIL